MRDIANRDPKVRKCLGCKRTELETPFLVNVHTVCTECHKKRMDYGVYTESKLVRFTKAEVDALDKHASATGNGGNEIIREALNQYLSGEPVKEEKSKTSAWIPFFPTPKVRRMLHKQVPHSAWNQVLNKAIGAHLEKERPNS